MDAIILMTYLLEYVMLEKLATLIWFGPDANQTT